MDEQPYFAHSANEAGHWHLLCDHLSSVAARARVMAGQAPWADEAELAGLLHDLAKYGDLFQGRLRGEQRGIDQRPLQPRWPAKGITSACNRAAGSPSGACCQIT